MFTQYTFTLHFGMLYKENLQPIIIYSTDVHDMRYKIRLAILLD